MNVYFHEVEHAVRHGVTLQLDGASEKFNVLLFVVTDLAFLEKMLGKCSSNSLFGCFWCKASRKLWSQSNNNADKQTIRVRIL